MAIFHSIKDSAYRIKLTTFFKIVKEDVSIKKDFHLISYFSLR